MIWVTLKIEEGVTVGGRVFDPDGNPMANVTVIITFPGHPLPLQVVQSGGPISSKDEYSQTQTDIEGTFEATGCHAGAALAYGIVNSQLGYDWAVSEKGWVKSAAVSFQVSKKGDTEIEIQFARP